MAKKMCKKCFLENIAFVLVIIGALNWGLVGFFNYNLVYAFLGAGLAARIIYGLVGASGIYLVYYLIKK